MTGWVGKEENCRSWLHYRFFPPGLQEGVLRNNLYLFVELWSQEKNYFIKKLLLEFSWSLVAANVKNEMVLVQERFKRIIAGVLQNLTMIWQEVLPTHPHLQLLCQAAVEICSLWKSWGVCECFWFVLFFWGRFFGVFLFLIF